jgi:hypothetical protein
MHCMKVRTTSPNSLLFCILCLRACELLLSYLGVNAAVGAYAADADLSMSCTNWTDGFLWDFSSLSPVLSSVTSHNTPSACYLPVWNRTAWSWPLVSPPSGELNNVWSCICDVNWTRGQLYPSIFHGSTALVGLGLLVVESSRSHLDTPHLVGLLWASDEPDAETYLTTHNTEETGIHAHGRIQIHNPSKRATADLRLRQRGQSFHFTYVLLWFPKKINARTCLEVCVVHIYENCECNPSDLCLGHIWVWIPDRDAVVGFFSTTPGRCRSKKLKVHRRTGCEGPEGGVEV